MTDNLLLNTARSLASSIAEAGKNPKTPLSREFIRGLIASANDPIIIRLPNLPDVDSDYRPMAARNGKGGLSADLDQELRDIEDAPEPDES